MSENNIEIPDACFRGLRKQEWLTNDGVVLGAAFIPNYKTVNNRQDNHAETSINWKDDQHCEEFTLKQDTSTYGLAELTLQGIEIANQCLSRPNDLKAIQYERKSLRKNPYHGNLLFDTNIERKVISMLAGVLALKSEWIEPKSQ